ncbi:NUDIX domain-containing protein [Actinomadura sp. KC06]|uniref:NUDIX domain-containing protein n=1 Tax=Actinomadura sp. KC06 TaxID=2530369 RepID=UPI00104DFA15|nr:NUDIX domain-containing protein [Actinomadura sp. KC06]TDD32789.1 NUDIX domain-containing protein [Actinomadura sp. KC06]
MKIRYAALRARGRDGSVVHRLTARAWRRLGGRMQWRLARLRHRTFLVYAGGLVRDDQGRILLLRHRLWPAYRAWGLPGGYVDAGERLEDGVAREVREETSLEVQVSGPPAAIASGFRHRVEAYYEARVIGGDLGLDAAEILEARWYPLDDLPDEMSPSLRDLITSLGPRRPAV